MAYLTKEEALIKLSSFGVNSISSLNRLIREQGLPAKFISPRKKFFDEDEINTWLDRRHEVVARANATTAKVQEYQRKKRKIDKGDFVRIRTDADKSGRDGREEDAVRFGVAPLSTKGKQTAAQPAMAKETELKTAMA